MVSFLGLGSNLGDRLKNIENAVCELSNKKGIFIKRVSGVYETEPVGGPEQPFFLNAALEIETGLCETDLLKACMDVEKYFGRTRDIKWGPRIIDIDILLSGEKIINHEKLEIPHPLMHERAFVLVPLSEIAPDAVHPILNSKVSKLLEKMDVSGVKYYSKMKFQCMVANE